MGTESKKTWGGNREGSGRPASKEPKDRVSLLLSVKSIKKLDKLRKDTNRSQFVDELIKSL